MLQGEFHVIWVLATAPLFPFSTHSERFREYPDNVETFIYPLALLVHKLPNPKQREIALHIRPGDIGLSTSSHDFWNRHNTTALT